VHRRSQILPDLEMIFPDDRPGPRKEEKRQHRSDDENGCGLGELRGNAGFTQFHQDSFPEYSPNFNAPGLNSVQFAAGSV